MQEPTAPAWARPMLSQTWQKNGFSRFLLPAALWPMERPARQRTGTLCPTRRSAFPCSPHSPEAGAPEVSQGLWPRWPGVGAALPEDSSTSSVYCREPSPWCRTNPSGSLSSSSEGGPPAPAAPGRPEQAGRLLLQQGCSSSPSPFSGTGHQVDPGTRSRSKGSSSRKQLSSSVRQPRISADISGRMGRGSMDPGGSGVQEGTERAPPPPPQAGGCPAPETTPGRSGRHPQPCPARACLDGTPAARRRAQLCPTSPLWLWLPAESPSSVAFPTPGFWKGLRPAALQAAPTLGAAHREVGQRDLGSRLARLQLRGVRVRWTATLRPPWDARLQRGRWGRRRGWAACRGPPPPST